MENFKFKGENRNYDLTNRTFEEFHGITMAFITVNEERDIRQFIEHIRPHVGRIVMVDGGSSDRTVEIASSLVDEIKIVPFAGHLGNQKNIAISMSFTDWTLFLDPDERLTDSAIKMLPSLINQDEFDCYSFPRREFLSGKENQKPYPDYQDRLFRTYCRYVRPIHHELVGYKKKKTIEMNSGVEIIHSKEMNRHINRNTGHSVFEKQYKHEMGMPGQQTKETFISHNKHLNESVAGDKQL